MVVKSASKKKLIDLGFTNSMAHLLANDRKWDDIKDMSPEEIYEIIKIDLEQYLPWSNVENTDFSLKSTHGDNMGDTTYLTFW